MYQRRVQLRIDNMEFESKVFHTLTSRWGGGGMRKARLEMRVLRFRHCLSSFLAFSRSLNRLIRCSLDCSREQYSHRPIACRSQLKELFFGVKLCNEIELTFCYSWTFFILRIFSWLKNKSHQEQVFVDRRMPFLDLSKKSTFSSFC